MVVVLTDETNNGSPPNTPTTTNETPQLLFGPANREISTVNTTNTDIEPTPQNYPTRLPGPVPSQNDRHNVTVSSVTLRAQLRQVLGIDPPQSNTLQQAANQLRNQPRVLITSPGSTQHPLETQVRSQLLRALNPFDDENQTSTQMVHSLGLPRHQQNNLESQVRAQIVQALDQAQQNLSGSQQNILSTLGLRGEQRNLYQQLENRGVRRPLLQALNLSQQDMGSAHQAFRPGTGIFQQPPSQILSCPHNQPFHASSSIFSSSSLPLTVIQEYLGSKEASTKEDYMFLADCSFRAHRHEELLNHVRGFLSLREPRRDLVKDERYFIAVAYKDSVRGVRDAWRKIRKNETDEKDSFKLRVSSMYRGELEEKMRIICSEGLQVSGRLLVDGMTSMETRLYFYKVKGDLYRYMAEYSTSTAKAEAASQGQASYEEADRIKNCVSSVHPLRLGLALNFGVFLRDACQDSSRGWRVTKVALDEANRGFQMLAELDTNDYRESNGLLMNLRRNLMRWNTAEIDVENPTALAQTATVRA